MKTTKRAAETKKRGAQWLAVKVRKVKVATAVTAKEQLELIMAMQAKATAQIRTSQVDLQVVLLLMGELLANLRGHVASASSTSSIMSTAVRLPLLPSRLLYKGAPCPPLHTHASSWLGGRCMQIFMKELCSLSTHIPTYLDIMRCYNHVLH
jgi:hypothetical protein